MLDSEYGLPLGILPNVHYDQKLVQLHTGDELFLYTDGIFELPLRGKVAKQCSSLQDFFDGESSVTAIQLGQLKWEIAMQVAEEQIADDINYISIQIVS